VCWRESRGDRKRRSRSGKEKGQEWERERTGVGKSRRVKEQEQETEIERAGERKSRREKEKELERERAGERKRKSRRVRKRKESLVNCACAVELMVEPY
jgi:hypothetical protein